MNQPLLTAFWSKFSILCEVFPFIGRKHKWKYLMVMLSKETQTVWEKNELAFTNLYTSIRKQAMEKSRSWHDDPIEIQELFSDIYGYDAEIDCNFELRACMENDMDLDFLTKAKDFRFPNFKCLDIHNISECESKIKVLNNFLQLSSPISLNKFKIGCLSAYFQIKPIIIGLQKVLESVNDQVEIREFDIDQQSFYFIVKLTSKCSLLRFSSCKIEMEDNFELNSNVDFKNCLIYEPQGEESNCLKMFFNSKYTSSLQQLLEKENLSTVDSVDDLDLFDF